MSKRITIRRSGDFWEARGIDAHTMADALDLTVGRDRATGEPLSAIPAHCLDSWIRDLIGKGIEVVIPIENGQS